MLRGLRTKRSSFSSYIALKQQKWGMSFSSKFWTSETQTKRDTLRRCCGLNVCIPFKLHTKILSLKVMVFWRGAFERGLGHGDRALMSGISILKKEASERNPSLLPSHSENTVRSQCLRVNRPSPDTESSSTLIRHASNFQSWER
jgi:hypothetical protein